MNVTTNMVEEFKDRMHISHSAEDSNLKQLLSFSISSLKETVGDFDVETNNRAKELVFERSRYAYNDSVEYFNDNFLNDIISLSLSLAFEKEGVHAEE